MAFRKGLVLRWKNNFGSTNVKNCAIISCFMFNYVQSAIGLRRVCPKQLYVFFFISFFRHCIESKIRPIVKAW